ncbi:putative esterase [Segniliparus rotundus DSM 44985]|uniref:Putative esterase n=1 Tax=Segniliparus rotundus (strain ATCC BAA-972 / CDC 1076 / CIP 108378 / DSM 44985 / JCM 13578) TaxID=640132 RepID=D6ZCU5_SEGRD|nr:alpha/beta hydrolase family protein [Segniliparus rotundus]ADG99132.1 putative esterase [Segniliparus rotundus DSM 44985]
MQRRTGVLKISAGVMAAALGFSFASAPQASAMEDPGPIPAVQSSADDPGPLAHVQEYYVPTPEMPDVKLRVWRATNGSKKSVVLLDGLRATNDVSGWEHETNAHLLADHGVNVIEPVGGNASFYTDWQQPSQGNNQPYRYMWATFIGKTLPAWMASQGLDPNGNAIAGLSMAGSSAFILAANYPDKYKFAAAYSGYMNLDDGSRGQICISMWSEQGFSCDSMWGPGYNDTWKANDPVAQLDKLRNTSLYLSWGNGDKGPWDDDYAKHANYGPINSFSAGFLEGIIKGDDEKFKQAADATGVNVTYNIQPWGTHMWPYWEYNLWNSLDQMKTAIGA